MTNPGLATPRHESAAQQRALIQTETREALGSSWLVGVLGFSCKRGGGVGPDESMGTNLCEASFQSATSLQVRNQGLPTRCRACRIWMFDATIAD